MIDRKSRVARTRRLAGAALALAALACRGDGNRDGPIGPIGPLPPLTPAAATPLPPLAPGELAIVGVAVVPMTGPAVLQDHTVLVRDGLIVRVAPRPEVEIPAGALVIDGAGRWVLPGLMDMHAHVRDSDLEAYRRAGITTIRNMWGHGAVAALRMELITDGDLPMIFSAGPGLDGASPVWPGTVVVTDAEAARAEVRRQAAEGWDFIKVYNSLRPDVYGAILSEAGTAGISVVGHVPLAAGLEQTIVGGQASVEHLTGIAEAVAGGRGPAGWLRFDGDDAEAVAAALAERGVWVCPTLAVLRHLAVRNLGPADAARAQANQGAMVRALHGAGVPLLAGTDAGIGATAAGSSLALELELLVDAGLSPYDALRAATTEAARFLAVDHALGTVEAGRRADLLILDGNPLEDVAAVRDPVGLIQRGRRVF